MVMRRRLVSALVYSIEGFGAAWNSEEAIKVEILLLPLLVGLSLYLEPEGLARAMLIGVLLMVVVVELLNTAIEKTIDRISTEQNPLSKKVKDMGSAAVLGAIINAVTVWTLVLTRH
ncbi:MAG: diacylglycerol kinase [Burkholderiaceae bacterium]|jgi:diacylglycerol kinase (ATP)|nr:diacylglycerol kinase [Burkholderiaceae bacterium]